MDTEIKTLNKKILELNVIIENLKIKLNEYEKKELNINKEKNINEKFCELYQNLSKKKIIQNEIDMIIGVYLAKQEKKYEKKYNSLLEVQNRLKKRISDLTGQINTYKYGKKLPTDFEEYKIETEVNNDENKQMNHKSYTFQRYINKKTDNKKIGDIIETTKTAQIAYKRKKEGDNQ